MNYFKKRKLVKKLVNVIIENARTMRGITIVNLEGGEK
jgi:hypothetical protein